MQSDSMPAQEMKAKSKINLKVIVLVVLVLALLGAGYWAMQTNDKLTAETADLASWQSKYDTLKTEKAGLDSDLAANKSAIETSQADLDATQKTMTTTKADLTKAKQSLATLQKEMDKAALRVDLIRGLYDGENTNAIIYLKLILIDDDALTQGWNDANSFREVRDWFITLLNSAITILEAAN